MKPPRPFSAASLSPSSAKAIPHFQFMVHKDLKYTSGGKTGQGFL